MATPKELTAKELHARGDIAILRLKEIAFEVDEDGTAWIDVGDIEICYHPGKGWLVIAPDETAHRSLAEALRVAAKERVIKAIETPTDRLVRALPKGIWK